MTTRSLFLWLLLAWPAVADKDSAVRAYERGDFRKAIHEWRALANKDDPEAEFRLGAMYERGEGTAMDLNQAVNWYRKAAYQGRAQAQYALGMLVANGKGTSQDDVLASMWLNLASSAGDTDATKELAELTIRMTPQQVDNAQRLAKDWVPAFPIGRDVAAPVILSKIDPEYPEEARKAHYGATVTLDVVIDATGQVQDIHLESPVSFGLDRRAIEAVRKWTFRPGSRNGHPVAVQSTITVSFREL